MPNVDSGVKSGGERMPLTSVIALLPGLAAVGLVVAALLGGCSPPTIDFVEACAKVCAPHGVARVSHADGCVCAPVKP